MNPIDRPKRIALAFLAVSALLAGCTGDDSAMSETRGTSENGKSGSMARFQVVGDHLYALSQTTLQVYNVADPAAMSFLNSVEVGFGIETLFGSGDKLYVGSQSGMSIYDITDKTLPVFQSTFAHFRSCDPVVVQGGIAYLTLRDGSRCWGGKNELHIIDVKDAQNPVKLKSYPMANPHGLGIDGDLLFICDGYSGLKIYGVGPNQELTLKQHISGIETYDVIPYDNGRKLLILIGKDGLYQYDYKELPIRKLSRIDIGEA